MRPQRFLALLMAPEHAAPPDWKAQVSERLASAGLTALVQIEDAALYTAAGTISVLGHDHIIIGPVFEQGARARTAPRGEMGQEELLATHWGAYISLCRTRTDGWSLLRDPSAGLPCYYIQGDGWLALASDYPLLCQAGLLNPVIRWPTVFQLLQAIQYRCRETGLDGLLEILPGEQLIYEDGQIRTQMLWSPWSIAAAEQRISDFDAAAALVRQVVLDVVAVWASHFDRPLLSVSGGLDSSIVAAALAATRADILCYTLSTNAPLGDERPFARALAAHLRAPLHEAQFDVSRIELTFCAGAHLPRPGTRAFLQETDRASMAIAGAVGADGLFHGGGGDNVFCSITSVAPILDRVAVEGWGRGAWRTTGDVAALTGADMWSLGRHLIERLWSGRRYYRWAVDNSLLDPKRVESWPLRFDHPWLQVPKDGLAGSATHIASLLAIQNYLEGSQTERSLFSVAPLLAQPLVELCLRIPSWLWVAEGMNRSVARAAFRRDLPPLIMDRRVKGTPDSVAASLFEMNRPMLREWLLDGLLAAQGLLDRDAIEQVLADPLPAHGTAYRRIMSFCDFEAWARSVGRLGAEGRSAWQC